MVQTDIIVLFLLKVTVMLSVIIHCILYQFDVFLYKMCNKMLIVLTQYILTSLCVSVTGFCTKTCVILYNMGDMRPF